MIPPFFKFAWSPLRGNISLIRIRKSSWAQHVKKCGSQLIGRMGCRLTSSERYTPDVRLTRRREMNYGFHAELDKH